MGTEEIRTLIAVVVGVAIVIMIALIVGCRQYRKERPIIAEEDEGPPMKMVFATTEHCNQDDIEDGCADSFDDNVAESHVADECNGYCNLTVNQWFKRKMQRKEFILVSINTGKVTISTTSDYNIFSGDTLVFPHETDLTKRWTKYQDSTDDQKQKETNDLKTIRSWRARQKQIKLSESFEEGNNAAHNSYLLNHQTDESSVSSASQNNDISTSCYSHKTCPICLKDYKNGDEICWSTNENCYHAMHTECMVDWLSTTDECCLCRENYLSNDRLPNESSVSIFRENSCDASYNEGAANECDSVEKEATKKLMGSSFDEYLE